MKKLFQIRLPFFAFIGAVYTSYQHNTIALHILPKSEFIFTRKIYS